MTSLSKMWTRGLLPILLLFNFSLVDASFFRSKHINAQSQKDRLRRDALLGGDSSTWTPEQFLDDAVDDDELKKIMEMDDDNDQDDEVDTVTDSPTYNPLESADDDYYPDPPSTSAPSKAPTPSPTLAPTPSPTNSPTALPSQLPTINPLESADDDYYPGGPPKTSSPPSVNPLESADDDYYPSPKTSTAFPSSSPSVPTILSKALSASESPSSRPSFKDDDDLVTSVPSLTPSQNDDEFDTTPPSVTPLDQDSSSPSKAPTQAPVHHWPTHPPTIAPTRTPTFMPTSEAWADKVKDEEERLKALAEDRTAEVVAGVIAVLGIIGMLLTAYQLFENPDGLCASCCRLSLKISTFLLKVICLPCRLCCGRYSGYHTSDPENRTVFVEEYTNDLELT